MISFNHTVLQSLESDNILTVSDSSVVSSDITTVQSDNASVNAEPSSLAVAADAEDSWNEDHGMTHRSNALACLTHCLHQQTLLRTQSEQLFMVTLTVVAVTLYTVLLQLRVIDQSVTHIQRNWHFPTYFG